MTIFQVGLGLFFAGLIYSFNCLLPDPWTNNVIMIEYLKRHKAMQDTWALEFGKGFNPLNLVSCERDGSPITPNALQHVFKDIVTANELPNVRFHDLRHTNATMMLRSKVPAKIVSSMLGHSNIGITLDTYSHVMISSEVPIFQSPIFSNNDYYISNL